MQGPEKLIFPQLLKKLPAFRTSEELLLGSDDPPVITILSQINPVHERPFCFF
jgi:hypothetical protein